MEVILIAVCVFMILLTISLIFICLEELDDDGACPRHSPPPRRLKLQSVESKDMNYIYTFSLPAPRASDVVTREVHIVVGGVETVFTVDPTATQYVSTFEENAVVSMFLVDIDDAGNRSAQGEVLTFTVLDTVAPPAPSMPEIIAVIEGTDTSVPPVEPPVVEPPIEVPPVEVPADPVVETPVETPEVPADGSVDVPASN